MSLLFTGGADQTSHGDIAAVDGAAALTVMAWLRPDSIGISNGSGIGYLFEKNGSDGPSAALNDATMGDIRAYTDTGNSGRTGVVLAVSTWAHVAYVFDGAGVGNAARLKVYVDGISQSLTFVGTIPATLPSSTAALLLGTPYSGRALLGRVAFLKAWTAALSAAEVLNEMRARRPHRTANLFLWAPYDDGSSARDYSGSGNHGTAAGNVVGSALSPPGAFGGGRPALFETG